MRPFLGSAANRFQKAFELQAYVEAWDVGAEQDLYAAYYEDAAREAAVKIQPLVARCLIDNWKATGLGNTGQMVRILEKTVVRAYVRGKKIQLKMFMAPDAGKYGKTSAFTVAGALNFGAVRLPKKVRPIVDTVTGRLFDVKERGTLGAKAKRTVKQFALTGKISNRARLAIERGSTLKSGRQTDPYHIGEALEYRDNPKLGISTRLGGGAVVIAGKQFFYLTQRQANAIGAQFLAHMSQSLQRRS